MGFICEHGGIISIRTGAKICWVNTVARCQPFRIQVFLKQFITFCHFLLEQQAFSFHYRGRKVFQIRSNSKHSHHRDQREMFLAWKSHL